MSDRVYARVPFTYDRLDVERGEVFELIGARNDEKLTRLRYVVELKTKEKIRKCDDCGKEFVDFGFYGHRTKQHKREDPTDKDYVPLFEKEAERA